MATVIRNVHFHHLSVSDQTTKNRNYYDGDNLKQIFLSSMNKRSFEYVEEGYTITSKRLTDDIDEVILDLIDIDKHFAFCRLARKKDINTIQKRNGKNLAPVKISLGDDERLEVYSYFLVDFETGIVTNLYYRSAPSIRNIDHIFWNLKINGRYIESELHQIPNDNALSMIEKMTYFGKLEMKFAIPAESFFKKMGVQLTSTEFKSLAKLKSKNITVIIGGGNENISENNYRDIKKCINDLIGYKMVINENGTTNGILERMKFTGNMLETQSKSVNLLDEHFVEQVPLAYEDTRTYIPIKTVYKALKKIYTDKRDELIERTGTTTMIR